jgi:hypothetical protein
VSCAVWIPGERPEIEVARAFKFDGKLRWMVVSPTGNEGVAEHYSRYRRRAVVDDVPTAPSPTRAATAALDRIGLPQAAIDRSMTSCRSGRL